MQDNELIRKRIIDSTKEINENLYTPYITISEALWSVIREGSSNPKFVEELHRQFNKISNTVFPDDPELDEALMLHIAGTPKQLLLYNHLVFIVIYIIKTQKTSSLLHLILSRSDKKFVKTWERILDNSDLCTHDFVSDIEDDYFALGNRLALITILTIFDMPDNVINMSELYNDYEPVIFSFPSKVNLPLATDNYTTEEDGYCSVTNMLYHFFGEDVPHVIRALNASSDVMCELQSQRNVDMDEPFLNYGSIPAAMGLDVEALAYENPIPQKHMMNTCNMSFRRYINTLMNDLDALGFKIDRLEDGLDGLLFNGEKVVFKSKYRSADISLSLMDIISDLYFRLAIPLAQVTNSYHAVMSSQVLPEIQKTFENSLAPTDSTDTTDEKLVVQTVYVDNPSTAEALAKAEKKIKELEKKLYEQEKENAELKKTITTMENNISSQISDITKDYEEKIQNTISLNKTQTNLLKNAYKQPSNLIVSPKDELYAGETKEHLLAILKDYIKAHSDTGTTRRYDIANNIIGCNPSSNLLEQRKALISSALKGYKVLDATQKSLLDEAGLKLLRQDGSHYIFSLYGDERYLVTISKTASDGRTGMNAIKLISNTML